MHPDSASPAAGREQPSPARAVALPPVYLSHGSPMIALEPGRTGAFFAHVGRALAHGFEPPRAVLAVSAHSALPASAAAHGIDVALLAAARHETVHDFGGFDRRLFEMRWDAPGAPDLAEEVASLLQGIGLRPAVLEQGGLDHGIWTALGPVNPRADWPVLPLAWPMQAPPAALAALGTALAPLADRGVWIVASGSITHDLARVFKARAAFGTPDDDMPEIPESRAFRTWIADRSAAADWPALLDWARRAPHGRAMHPSDEHLLPWFVAAGAGAPATGLLDAPPALRLHQGVTFGCLGMDAYAFGPHAARLQQALAAVD